MYRVPSVSIRNEPSPRSMIGASSPSQTDIGVNGCHTEAWSAARRASVERSRGMALPGRRVNLAHATGGRSTAIRRGSTRPLRYAPMREDAAPKPGSDEEELVELPSHYNRCFG